MEETQEQSKDSTSSQHQSRLAHTASRVAIANIASNIVGLVREIVVARTFGTGVVADAYYYATLCTGKIFFLFGGLNGPVDTCTVAILDRKSATERTLILWKILKVTLVSFSVLTAILYLIAPLLIPLVSSFYQPRSGIQLAPGQAKVLFEHELSCQLNLMLPMIIMAGLLGNLYGVARTNNRVTLPSLAPAIQSAIVIAFVGTGCWLCGVNAGWPLALGTVVGALVQLIVQIPGNIQMPPKKSEEDSAHVEQAVLEYKKTINPALLGTSVGQLTTYIDSAFALALGTGAWTAITYANKLTQVPLAVLVTAIIVPMFPRFTKSANAGDAKTFEADFHRSMRFLWFATLAALAMFAALARPVVRILFQGGEFNTESVDLVTLALLFQIPSMFFYVGRELMTRVFYAVRDTQTPFKIACFMLGCKALLDALFVWHFKMDVAGISLATTLVIAINFIVLTGLLARQGDLAIRKLIGPVLRMIAAAGFCWYATNTSFALLSHHMGAGKVSALSAILVAAAAGLLTYIAACLLLRVEESRLIFDQFRRLRQGTRG